MDILAPLLLLFYIGVNSYSCTRFRKLVFSIRVFLGVKPSFIAYSLSYGRSTAFSKVSSPKTVT